jgi:hypothetical protein
MTGNTEPSYNFKTPEGQAAFMAAYDRALAGWPVAYEAVFVPTRFGLTGERYRAPSTGDRQRILIGNDICPRRQIRLIRWSRCTGSSPQKARCLR